MYAIYYPENMCYYVCTVGKRDSGDCPTDNFCVGVEDAALWPTRDSALAMMRYLLLDADGCEVVKV